MIKLVVWDWNGTLFDDTAQIVLALNEQLAIYDTASINVKKYQETYRVPVRQCFRDLGVSNSVYDERSTEAIKHFHDSYEVFAEKASLRTDAVTILHELKNLNIPSLLLSNHIVTEIERQLLRFEIAEHFSDILANDTIGMVHSTGKQQRLEHYLQMHELDPEAVVIVGDTVEEITIAKNLDLKSISITGGANSTDRLKNARPDLLVHSLREIIPALEEKKWL